SESVRLVRCQSEGCRDSHQRLDGREVDRRRPRCGRLGVGSIELKLAMRVSIVVFVLFLAAAVVGASGDKPPAAAPTFYRDVLPILQKHCQQCHRAGEIAPMPLVTYDDVRRWTRQIANDTPSKRMPPCFPDACPAPFPLP